MRISELKITEKREPEWGGHYTGGFNEAKAIYDGGGIIFRSKHY